MTTRTSTPAATTPDSPVVRLLRDGLIDRLDGVLRTTPRWRAAMARALLALYRLGDDVDDRRVPIAWALVEIYGGSLPDSEMVSLVETLLALEVDAPSAGLTAFS